MQGLGRLWKAVIACCTKRKSGVAPGEGDTNTPAITNGDQHAAEQTTEHQSNGHASGAQNSPDNEIQGQDKSSTANGTVKKGKQKDMNIAFATQREQYSTFDKTIAANKKKGWSSDNESETKSKDPSEEEDKMPAIVIVDDCCCASCYRGCCACPKPDRETPSGKRWYNLRRALTIVVDHKVFEGVVMFLIVASSAALAFEDVYLDLDPVRQQVLFYLDITFAVLFGLEMVLKWIAYGFKKYFTNFWTILDFFIVMVSVASLVANAFGAVNISAFRVLRTLRAFRPLRAISRWNGMRIVVNALMLAIPSIFNVLLVCLIFWLIFSILGVQFFAGKFYKCVYISSGERVDHTIVPDRATCESNPTLYQWKNSNLNFDNVGTGLLSLLQVATFEGWMEVMIDAIDSTAVDVQPRYEASFGYYLYFAIFIIFGSFFTLNLFIGVIIDNFNMLKKKYEGTYLDMFLTNSQRTYYNTMKKLGNRKPQKTIKRPKNKVQAFFFDIAISSNFELAIVVLIFCNMLVMAVEHYKQDDLVTEVLAIINIVFTTVFTLEAIVKIIGLRWHYFRRAWNVFDFIVVILSIVETAAGVILDDLLKDVFITPTLLRVVRIFRIGRVLRLIKAAKGIRKLLFALIISVPALFNIGGLLFLIVFIYAIVGMSLFGHIKHTDAINDLVNFETFERSVLLLFRLTTSAGWNDVLGPMYIQPPDCNQTHYTDPAGNPHEDMFGECSIPGLAVFYMMSFVMITFLIVINMYIAVILENFNQAHEQEEVGITEDDFEMFYVVWERYDPHASQFIKLEQLSDFVGDLDQPLGIPKPNDIALVAFDLPIVDGEKLHCLDILIALVRHVLGDVEETNEFRELKDQMEDKFKETFPTRIQEDIISTTMRRKKEDVAAKTLQRAWRKHKAQKTIRLITAQAMAQKHRPSSAISGISRKTGASNSPNKSPNRSVRIKVPPKSPKDDNKIQSIRL